MRDPQLIHMLARATLLGGSIVMLGAGYALLHALGRMRDSKALMLASLACYLGLAVAVVALTLVLDLSHWWIGLSATLLLGYFVAPRFIWRLSVAVHADTDAELADADLAIKRSVHE